MTGAIDGTRFLISDMAGSLFVVVLTIREKLVTGVSVDTLGQVSLPSTITYLDSG
jgi:hypothetical protein